MATEEWFKKLQCSVCFEPLSRLPIYTTLNGLNVCGRCDVPARGVKNDVYATVVENIRFPCRYSKSGCLKKLAPKNVLEHEEKCIHRIHKTCITNDFTQCTISVPNRDLKSHCREFHSEHFIRDAHLEFNLTGTQPQRSAYLWEHEGDVYIWRCKYKGSKSLLTCKLTGASSVQYKLDLTCGSRSLSFICREKEEKIPVAWLQRPGDTKIIAKLSFESRMEPVDLCKFCFLSCPLREFLKLKCNWRGAPTTFADHLRAHEETVISLEDYTFTVPISRDYEIVMFHVVSFADHYFRLLAIEEMSRIYFLMQKIGQFQGSFSYSIDMVTVSRIVRSIFVNQKVLEECTKQELMNRKRRGYYFLTVDQFRSFFDQQNKITFEVRMDEENPEPGYHATPTAGATAAREPATPKRKSEPPTPEPKPEAKYELKAAPEPRPSPEADPETKPEVSPKPESSPEAAKPAAPTVESEATPESKAAPEPEADPETKPEAPAVESEPVPVPAPKPELKPKPSRKSSKRRSMGTPPKSIPEPEGDAERKPEAKADPGSGVIPLPPIPVSKPAPAPEPEPEPIPEPVPEPIPDNPDANHEIKHEES